MSKITYRQVGDYLIPNLKLPPEEANITLGKWGMMHKSYLEKNKKVFFSLLLGQGKLYQHCAEVEKQAQDMFDALVEQMKESEAVTEQLKEENQLEWVCVCRTLMQGLEKLLITKLYLNKNISIWLKFESDSKFYN